MSWSYGELQDTPEPVVEDAERWMREQYAEAERERKRRAAERGR